MNEQEKTRIVNDIICKADQWKQQGRGDYFQSSEYLQLKQRIQQVLCNQHYQAAFFAQMNQQNQGN